MKKILAVSILISLVALPLALAQQKSLSSTLNVYVFPTEGQDAEQQSKDEAECYGWAVQNTGKDPFELQKKAAEQEQQTAEAKEQAQDVGKGAGAAGAVEDGREVVQVGVPVAVHVEGGGIEQVVVRHVDVAVLVGVEAGHAQQ